MTDQQILIGIMQNDERAWKYICRNMKQGFVSILAQTFSFGNLSNEDIEDVFQESCILLMQKIMSGDVVISRQGALFSYLVQIGKIISMGAHATTENLNRCGEFTVAFAIKETMVASNLVGIMSAKNDPKKMMKTGWTAIKSEYVNAPVFTDFPITMECRILRKIDESEEGYYIVAEIINILVDEAYLAEDGKPDVEKMELITYDSVHHGYISLGQRIGNAFSDGKKVKSNLEI